MALAKRYFDRKFAIPQSHLQYGPEGRIQMLMRGYSHAKSCHYALTAVPNNIPFQSLPICVLSKLLG
jgi:hypothetical protein